MAELVTNREDQRLTHGPDETPRLQVEAYLVLSEAERAKGFVRPLRDSYRHLTCKTVTTTSYALAATFARQPDFYTGTYCSQCRMHRPVTEFFWLDGEPVGS